MLADQGTDWAAWTEAIATAFAALVVLGTAVFALFSLVDARRTRHGQLVTELNRQWSEPAILQSFKLHGQYSNARITALIRRLCNLEEEAATDEDRAAYTELAALPNLIEAIGVLMSEKALSEEVIYKMWGGGIIAAWNAWADAVPLIRTQEREPDAFAHFQDVALAVQALDLKRKEALLRREKALRDATS